MTSSFNLHCASRAWLLVAAMLPMAAQAETGTEDGVAREALPALGIAETFGRWTGEVKLVYDPDGAPARFAGTSATLALISKAVDAWTTVSGIRMTLVGADSNIADDGQSPASQDGLVRIAWVASTGFAGRAGPDFGQFNADLGYFPYIDGAVELNDKDDQWEDDDALVHVLVHELGHLLGLGHSENPASVMFANPYNHLRHPREDDIRAMQALYGPPTNAINPAAPQSEWLFVAPAQAPASVTAPLFKANQVAGAPGFDIDDTRVTAIGNGTPKGDRIWIELGGVGGAAAIAHDVTIHLVDPFGYVYGAMDWEIKCPANFVCGGGSVTLLSDAVMRTMPGTWTAHVVEKNPRRTLLSMSLPVQTTVSFNRPPSGTLALVGRTDERTATFTLDISDPEGKPVTATWHLPGQGDVSQQVASGQRITRSVTFPQAGMRTLFISLRDQDKFYDTTIPGSDVAGEGFQTLIQARVNLLAGGGSTDLSVISSAIPAAGQGSGGAVVAREVLDRITSTTAQGGTCLPLGDCGGSFRMGASIDEGMSLRDRFRTGESVVIAGAVSPRTVDIGKGGEIFIVLRTGDTATGGTEKWTYRDVDGVFRDWNGQVSALQPAYTVSSLQANESFAMYSGSLAVAVQRLYIGYMPAGGSVLYFTPNALRLDITE